MNDDDTPTLFDFQAQAAELDRFTEFHRANPHVYRVLVDLARDWVTRTGRHNVGIKSLYEVARWQIAMQTSDADFKLNNDYTAYYARLIMLQEHDLQGLFALRKSAADELYPVAS
jgi:hypothetical protein